MRIARGARRREKSMPLNPLTEFGSRAPGNCLSFFHHAKYFRQPKNKCQH
jgi:hypothetical protein